MVSPNRGLLLRVATRLEPLLREIVFVGGQVTELLITDPAATRIRATDDVDAVCKAASRAEYYRLGERLKGLGFTEDTYPEAPTCRWRAGGDVVDVMPSEEEVLGFKSRWYPEVLETPKAFRLDNNLAIQIAAAPAFLATKADAFADRGHGDWYASHDIEDFIAVVAGRPTIIREIAASKDQLREFLVETAAGFMESGYFDDVLLGALPDARLVPGTTDVVMKQFDQIAKL